MKNLLFVINPRSGKGQIRTQLLDIIDIFNKNDYRVTIHVTQGVQDATSIVIKEGADYDLIVCSGGDGTLNETVSGIMRAGIQVPLGYIPAGSTNDFAVSLKIPKGMKQAAAIVVSGTPFQCDIGMFNDRYFNYVAAFGAFTEVSYATPQQLKNVLGHPAYILEGVKRIPSIKAAPMTVKAEEKTVEGEFIYGMISNSTSVGGFKKLVGSAVELDDGKFEVTLIRKPKNAIELQEIMGALLMEEMTASSIVTFRTARVEVFSPNEVPWVLDGEYGGNPKEIVVEIQKEAVQILCPQKS